MKLNLVRIVKASPEESPKGNLHKARAMLIENNYGSGWKTAGQQVRESKLFSLHGHLQNPADSEIPDRLEAVLDPENPNLIVLESGRIVQPHQTNLIKISRFLNVLIKNRKLDPNATGLVNIGPEIQLRENGRKMVGKETLLINDHVDLSTKILYGSSNDFIPAVQLGKEGIAEINSGNFTQLAPILDNFIQAIRTRANTLDESSRVA